MKDRAEPVFAVHQTKAVFLLRRTKRAAEEGEVAAFLYVVSDMQICFWRAI